MQEQEELLRELLHRVAKEKSINNYTLDIKPTSSQGANYTSALFYVTISSDQGENKLFAKVACVGENVRAMSPYRVFDTEHFFYTDLINTYRILEEKYNVPENEKLVTPEFFGVSMEYLKEVFVMEDLTSKGYDVFDRFKSIDWNYAKESMKQLAKLHALSLAYSIKLPEDFNRKTKDLKMQGDEQAMNEMYMKNFVPQILPCVKVKYRDRIERFLTQPDNNSMQQMLQPIKRTFLAHGDYRPSNLMHKQNKDGTYSVVPVDYQTLIRCNPIVDILYFIFVGSDQKFRAKYYQKTLDCYYTELCAALRRFELDPDDIYPRKDFEYELKKVLPYGLLISLVLLLIVTVEVDKVPVLNEELEMKDFSCSPSELYLQRMNEVVEDYIKLGVV